MIMGDFNSRIGKDREGIETYMGPFGEETLNEEGENLKDFCVRNNLKIMNSFYKQKESHMYTRYRWNRETGQFDQKSIIDYILTSDKRCFNNVKVLPGDSLDSDHRLLIGDIEVKERQKEKTKEKRKVIRTESLMDTEKRDKYREKINEGLDNLSENGKDWKAISTIIVDVAEEMLGVKWI